MGKTVEQKESSNSNENYDPDNEQPYSFSSQQKRTKHTIQKGNKMSREKKDQKTKKQRVAIGQKKWSRQKGGRGPPQSVWNEKRKKWFMMFFIESLMKNPQKSYMSTHWMQFGCYQIIEQYINKKQEEDNKKNGDSSSNNNKGIKSVVDDIDEIQPSSNIVIKKDNKISSGSSNRSSNTNKQRDQIKSYLQRMKNKLANKRGQSKQNENTFIVLVLQELYEEYVQKRDDKEVIELIQRFEREGREKSQLVRYVDRYIEKHDENMREIRRIRREMMGEG